MNSVDKATETQLKNIQTRTGRTLDQLYAVIRKSGLTKHGEIRDMLKNDLSMGHGDANTLVTVFLRTGGAPGGGAPAPATGDAVTEIYAGPRADLRPMHDKVMNAIGKFGPFEIAPKKGYLSLRRKKQFAMVGPGTKSRIDVGLNMKGIAGTERLVALPAGGMCQYRVRLTSVEEVDMELIGWIRRAYDSAE